MAGSSSSTELWAPRTPSPLPTPRHGRAAAAASEEEKLLRAVEREIERSYAAKRSSCPSPWRQLVQKATKKSNAASKKPSSAPPSPSRASQEAKKGVGIAGASGSGSKNQAEVGAEEESSPVGQAAALVRSCCAATMKCALARIQSGDVGDNGEAFTEMEQAMKGLMDVSFRKEKAPGVPRKFVSRWPRGDKVRSRRDVIADPLILASGDSIDKFSHHWSSGGADQPSLTAPNHLLRDVITSWCHDHSIPPPSATSMSTDIYEAPPSAKEMSLFLEKLSMHSVQQQEALHKIQLLSRSSKGVQPCLDQWQDLLPKLIDLHKKWKAHWLKELEEERLTIILNLSLHRPNREIVAKQEQLPDALKKTIDRAKRLSKQEQLATMAKVAAAIAVLSEFDVFREKVVEIGGIMMLRELLDAKDAVVRNEASAAILALCTDDAMGVIAELNHVPDALLECLSDGVVTDKCLLLLERTSHSNFVPDWIAAHVVHLMNVISQHARGHLTSRGIQTAICLIYSAVQQDSGRGRLRRAEKLDDFVEALRNLETKDMNPERVFQIEEILRIASEPLPD